ncbi:MAG: SpoIIE family protein phosphatase, partial [bacterium]|nr:SpoIIE family protein phosphatase [bacterium]
IGASIVFYSDGLVEASGNDGEPFGYDALAATLKSHRELTGGELQTEIIRSFDEFTQDRPLEDDLTLIVVSRGNDKRREKKGD